MKHINFMYADTDSRSEYLNLNKGDKIKILIPESLTKSVKEFRKGYILALYDGNGYFHPIGDDGSVNYNLKYHLLVVLNLLNDSLVRCNYSSLAHISADTSKHLIDFTYIHDNIFKTRLRIVPSYMNCMYSQLTRDSDYDKTLGCALLQNPKYPNHSDEKRKDGKLVLSDEKEISNKYSLYAIVEDRLDYIDTFADYLDEEEKCWMLINCARAGNVEGAKSLVKSGVDIHFNDDLALFCAIDRVRISFIKYLISLGVSPSVYGETALNQAGACGFPELFELFWNLCPEEHEKYSYYLDLVVINDKVEILEFLHKKGYDIHANNGYFLNFASSFGSTKSIKYLVKNGLNIHENEDKALITASFCGEYDAVVCLVELGADISAQDFKAVKVAKEKGHKEIFDYLSDLASSYQK